METLRIKVKPNSKKQAIQIADDGVWVVHLKSPPVEGKANAELIKLLADRFHVPKSSVTIKSGLTSKYKQVEIAL